MSITQFEEDKAQYVEQLDIVLSSLKDDPENAELCMLREELESAISMIDESIAELRPKKAAASASASAATAQTQPHPPPKTASPPPEKWKREDHPAFKKPAAEPQQPPSPSDDQPEMSYQINDNVLAKWVGGDKGFYPARITSVTGSSSARMYTVKFKSYGTVETLRACDIRPVAAPAQKRKADGTPVGGQSQQQQQQQQQPTPPPPPGSSGLPPQPPPPESTRSSDGVVLSASPSMYPPQQQTDGGEGSADTKPAKKFKKIKATKELEAGKNKWQDFNSKSKFGKSNKKDSMFRTPEGIHGRVGFTGSGQAMRKDASRSRHVYQPNEDAD